MFEPVHRGRDAGVSFGRGFIYRLSEESLGRADRTRPDLRTKTLAAVSFTFDLDEPHPRDRYREMSVTVTFDDPGVVALNLTGPCPLDREDAGGTPAPVAPLPREARDPVPARARRDGPAVLRAVGSEEAARAWNRQERHRV